MNKEEKRINYLLDTIIECPSMQADELRKRIKSLFKTINKQDKVIDKMANNMNAELDYRAKQANFVNPHTKEEIIEHFYKEIEKC